MSCIASARCVRHELVRKIPAHSVAFLGVVETLACFIVIEQSHPVTLYEESLSRILADLAPFPAGSVSLSLVTCVSHGFLGHRRLSQLDLLASFHTIVIPCRLFATTRNP